ncbi:MAG TPA: AMP-binding protein, partial [Fodinibius sp.]|nr:AMP-binding protein [Fodinibius sp.]
MNTNSKEPAFSPPLPIDRFLESKEQVFIYDDLRQFEHFLYTYLSNRNLLDGPIGLQLSSSNELVFLIAACWRLGIPFIAFDAATTPDKLSKQLKRTKAAALISDKKLGSLQAETHVIPSDTFSLTKILEPDFTPNKSIKRRKEEVQSNQDRIWGYFFTSGTTGSPKIVPLKRRQMLFAAKASAQNLQPDRNSLWLLCMSLHHIGGITVIIRSLLYGTGIYRLHRFESSSVTQLFFENPRLQAASLVPTMLKRLLDRSEFTAPDYFKAILLGGGPVSESLIDCCFERGIP